MHCCLPLCRCSPRCCGYAGFAMHYCSTHCCWHAGLAMHCCFPRCCVQRPVSLGPLSGFARRLQSPVETGTPARIRSEGARFLNRLDAARRLHSQMPLFRQSRMPSWDQICRFLSRMPFFKPLGLSCKPGKLLICNYLIINIIAKCGLPGEAKLVSPGRL